MAFELTEKEVAVVFSIAENSYRDSDDLSSPIWSDCLDDSSYSIPEGKALSGVCSSLKQKGLIGSNKSWDKNRNGGQDASTTWLTAKGIRTYKNLLASKEAPKDDPMELWELLELLSSYVSDMSALSSDDPAIPNYVGLSRSAIDRIEELHKQ